MPQSWDMGHIILLPLRRKAYCGFFGCPKNPTASAGFEPAISGSSGQYANHQTTEAVFPHQTSVCIVDYNSEKVLELTNAMQTFL
jgi:hypothetical protein